MALVYRVYSSYSTDGGEEFIAQVEVYGALAADNRRIQSMHQPGNVYWGKRQHDIMWTTVGGVVRIANAKMPPLPFVPKINKINRKRTFGNEL